MRFPIVTTILTLTTITLYFFAGAIPEQLIWYSDDQQQPWQWITGHFAHISVDHLLWNSIALAVLGTIIEQTSRKILLASLALGIFSIDLYLVAFYPMNAYAGLSGSLNTLLVFALYFLNKYSGFKLASVVTLVLATIKIVIEMSLGASLVSDLPWPPVPEAHFAGLLIGIIAVMLLDKRRKALLASAGFS